jgi:hypothetical protein
MRAHGVLHVNLLYRMAYKFGCEWWILNILLCHLVFGLTGAVNPGLKARVSQAGLNYAAQVAVDVLASRLQQITIPDQTGSADIKIGKVNYEFKNMKVFLFFCSFSLDNMHGYQKHFVFSQSYLLN